MTAVEQAGATLVLSDQILQLTSDDCTAHSKSRKSDNRKAQQNFKCDSFVKTAQHLLEQINLSAVGSKVEGDAMRKLALIACHATASCKLPPDIPAQSVLQRFLAQMQTFVKSILAAFVVVKAFSIVIFRLDGIFMSEQQQAKGIGECLLDLQTAVQRQTQQGSFMFPSAALAMTAVVLELSKDTQQGATNGFQQQTKQFMSLPCLNQLERSTLARCAFNCARMLALAGKCHAMLVCLWKNTLG